MERVFAVACALLAGCVWALWFRAIRRVAIPADRRGYLAAMAGAAALGALALALGPGWPGGVLAVVGMLAAALFALTVAISRQQGGSGAPSRPSSPTPCAQAARSTLSRR